MQVRSLYARDKARSRVWTIPRLPGSLWGFFRVCLPVWFMTSRTSTCCEFRVVIWWSILGNPVGVWYHDCPERLIFEILWKAWAVLVSGCYSEARGKYSIRKWTFYYLCLCNISSPQVGSGFFSYHFIPRYCRVCLFPRQSPVSFLPPSHICSQSWIKHFDLTFSPNYLVRLLLTHSFPLNPHSLFPTS